MVREELIQAMTASVLEMISPDEALLATAYSPGASRDGETAKGPRGFGAEAGIILLLPYVYRYFEKLVDRVAQKSGDAVCEMIKRWLKNPAMVDDPALIEMVEGDLRIAGLDKHQAAKAAPSVLKTIASYGKDILSGS